MAFTIHGLVSDGTLPSSAKLDLSADVGVRGSDLRSALDLAGLGRGGAASDASRLREVVRGGQVTSSRPLVAIGDSHTDNSASASNLWSYLKTVATLPGEGLARLDPEAIVPRGNNGQTLRHYLDNRDFGNSYNGTVALSPSVVLACWLTNDVRLGALGGTVAAVRDSGAALLGELLDALKADLPDTLIVLRVPTPYTTVDGGQGYVKTGAGVTNPAGLAQVYTDGVREAYYKAAQEHPGTLVYDPQSRFFGTTSPTANTLYYADQIHQNADGYIAEGKDFAAWVSAQEGFVKGRSDVATAVNPREPWVVYPLDVLDPSRYVQVAQGRVLAQGTIDPSGGYLDFQWPPSRAGEIVKGDIVHVPGKTPFVIPQTANIGAVATWTRLSSLGNTMDTSAPVVPQSTVRVYRKVFSWDKGFQDLIDTTQYQFKKLGKVMTGNTAVVDIGSVSWGAVKTFETGADWVTQAQPGDKVYFEGLTAARTLSVTTTSGSSTVTGSFTSEDVGRNITGTGIPAGAYVVSQASGAAVLSAAATASGSITATMPAVEVTLASSGAGAFAVSGVNFRVSGLSGTDWFQMKERLAVIVGNHA